MNEDASEYFETDFMSQSIQEQISQCDNYELAPLFFHLFNDKQPVLEAGCGSGRWCGWLNKKGIQCDGIDWSKKLIDRASREIIQSRFIACDMRNIPLKNNSYAALMALGSIEHSIDGPQAALKEFHRLLKSDGIGIITVPHGSRIRISIMYFTNRLKSLPLVRRILGKPIIRNGITYAQARKSTVTKWHPLLLHGSKGWFFFEYEFTRKQVRKFFEMEGFKVLNEFAFAGKEGLLQNFGRVVGKWNDKCDDIDLNLFGRILRALIPVGMIGHMLCYVVKNVKTS